MEDQKKRETIKNIRTVLPSMNLKGEEETERPTQADSSGASSEPSSTQSKLSHLAPVAEPSPTPQASTCPPPTQDSGSGYVYHPEQRPMPIANPPGRYKLHSASPGYTPYNTYIKGPVGYPPGRYPPHSKLRYYPPVARQPHPYVGEMPAQKPHIEHIRPVEKKPAQPPQPVLMPEMGGRAKVQIKDAMKYLEVVREEYKDNKEVYNKFLKVMKDFKEKKISSRSVIEVILNLFNGNQKLVHGFNHFLPRKYEILPSGEVKVHENERMDRTERTERAEGDRKRDEHTPNTPYTMHTHYYPHEHNRYSNYDQRSDLEGLGIGVKPLSPNGNAEDTKRVVAYMNKVRRHLERTPIAWFEFLKIVQSYKNNKEKKPIPEILSKIRVLLKDDPALIDEFMVFLPSNTVSALPETRHIRPLPRNGQTDTFSMLNDIKSILIKKGVYKEFLKALNMHSQGLIDSPSLILLLEPFLRPIPTLFSLFRYYIGYKEPESSPHLQPTIEVTNKIGSYLALKEKHRYARHKGQSPEDASVLNTELISCPTLTSESSTFIFAKKNIHEEALFRVEDERYEADLLLERISSLILKLMECEDQIVEETNAGGEQETEIDSAPALFLSEIDKEILSMVYTSSADSIILRLITHPIRAIPVVIKQLKNIEGQWEKARAACSDIWRATIDKNYIKSLDIKGYKIRNSEKKMSLQKQFMKDIDIAAEVEFVFAEKDLCCSVIDMLLKSIDPKEGDSVTIYLKTIKNHITTMSVFFTTIEIYCVLRGIAAICSRIREATSAEKRIKPNRSRTAEELSLQNIPKDLSREDVLSLLEKYIIGDMETAKFEESVTKGLGVSGTSLLGIASIFQNLESMIEDLSEGSNSTEMLKRSENRADIPEKNISQILLSGVGVIKVSIDKREGVYVGTASRIMLQHGYSPKWTEYVKRYSAPDLPALNKKPFLQRTLSRKRKIDVRYGMEHIFAEDEFKVMHVPGTEDFGVKKKKISSEGEK